MFWVARTENGQKVVTASINDKICVIIETKEGGGAMSNLIQNQIRYTVACISEFAKSKGLSKTQAFSYLLEHKALDFLTEFYDVEHTLSYEIYKNEKENGKLIQEEV